MYVEYISWLVVEPGWQTWRLLCSCGAPSVSSSHQFIIMRRKDDEDDDDEDDDDADADDADADEADEDKGGDGDSDPVCANIDSGHGDEADEDEYFERLAVDC